MGNPEQIRLKLRGQEEVCIYEDSGLPDMAYEIREFLRLVRENKAAGSSQAAAAGADGGDRECAEKAARDAGTYQNITTESLRITDEIRRQNGIVFPADRVEA